MNHLNFWTQDVFSGTGECWDYHLMCLPECNFYSFIKNTPSSLWRTISAYSSPTYFRSGIPYLWIGIIQIELLTAFPPLSRNDWFRMGSCPKEVYYTVLKFVMNVLRGILILPAWWIKPEPTSGHFCLHLERDCLKMKKTHSKVWH